MRPQGVLRHWWLGASWAPLAALAAALLVLAAWSVRNEFLNQRQQAGARLEALADLRRTQLENWIAGKLALARYAAGGAVLGEMFDHWQSGDIATGARVLTRVIELRQAAGADSMLVVSASGVVLASEHAATENPLAAPLQQAVRQALESAEPTHTGIYSLPGGAGERFDVVVPLFHRGARPQGVAVLRMDPGPGLLANLNSWPVPSASGESMLWRREGEQLVPTSRLLNSVPAQPLRESQLPAARVLRGDAPGGTAFVAQDYRGEGVLASVQPVAGTDWLLVAKINLGRDRRAGLGDCALDPGGCAADDRRSGAGGARTQPAAGA